MADEHEARLERARQAIGGALGRRFGDGLSNPLVLQDRIVQLDERCEALQRKIKTLADLKQELALALAEPDGVDEALARVPLGEAAEAARERLVRVEELIKDQLPQRQERRVARPVLEPQPVASDQGGDENAGDAQNVLADTKPAATVKQAGKREVDEDAFLSLPESVRGRAKLSDVQAALQAVIALDAKKRQQDKARGRRAASSCKLSIKDVDKMGAKVVGHTGSCVLASLRALGFVQVSREGVELLPAPQ